jgi:acyl-CoA synthetase (AMP-forming)/AMP-acid ligase II
MLSPLPPTIPHAAQAAAAAWPDAPAIIERGETWSFGDLWHRAQAGAADLARRGIERGDRIAIWAPNSRDWIVAAIAAMACGAQLVPLNTRLKGPEAAALLRRTGAKLLFTVRDFLGIDFLGSLAGQELPTSQQNLIIDEWSPPGATGAFPLDRIDSETICDILFTSGTTGEPKGVLMTHGRVLPQCAEWIRNTGLSKGERYLIANPFFHAFGTKVGWVACLLSGATALPMPQFDVEQAVRLIEDERINFLPGPPTIFQMLLARKDRADFDTSSLRGGTTGAATVPPPLIARIRDELGIRDIITAYGMTECVNITGCRPGDAVETIAKTCGAAIPGNEVKTIDDDGNTLPPGEAGEILVRGQGVMLGYLDDPAATAAAIDSDGWLHTGDIGVLDAQGYLTITDRKKDMFICGGFNVYPAEVERQLSAHPGIAQVAVIGVPDDRLGEVGKAFVVPRADPPTADELSAWARDCIANYKVPRSFEFVAALPVNAAGKVMKDRLRQPI